MRATAALGTVIASLLSLGCGSTAPPLPLAADLDLERFMGRWYVIGNIPTVIEQDAFNAVEEYRLGSDSRVETTFQYRDGAFSAEQKTYHPTGYVTSNPAVWGMQFVWPLRADYRVLHVDPDYRVTIIGRERRDYAWIMARTPELADFEFDALADRLRQAGYSDETMTKLRRVPQRW